MLEQTLEVEFQHVNPGTTLAISVDGVRVGSATAGADRVGADDVRVRSRIIEGTHASYALTQLLEDEQPGLVIMSAHGALQAANWAFGSVTRDLLFSAPTSLLIFQDTPRVAGRAELAGAGMAATPVV